MANYSVRDIYQGGYSSLDPSYGSVFTGYRVAAGELGAPTKPDTANQIQQVNALLNQGIVPIEVGVLQPETFDQIPKQHFKELKQMAKLTGSQVSLHAPLIEPSGMGEQGWSEAAQRSAEQHLTEIVEKAAEMDNKGNIPITIHPTGGQMLPGKEYKMTSEGKKLSKMIAVDNETGKPAQALEEERLFYPTKSIEPTQKQIDLYKQGKLSESEIKKLNQRQPMTGEGRIQTPEARLESINNTQWENSVSQLIFNKERADEILQKNQIQIQHLYSDLESGRINPENLTPTQKTAYTHLANVQTYLKDTSLNVESLFNKAYKHGSEKEKEYLRELSKSYTEQLNKSETPVDQSHALQTLLTGLQQVQPKLFVSTEEFVTDKTATTISNVALKGYDKFGTKAPVLSMENLWNGVIFSSAEDMQDLIEKTRSKFVEKATKSKNEGGFGLSKSVAKKQAEKMIGMTLDVGHLNIAKKSGFKDEDLANEVKKIAKYVKHVHLTDNFGHSDSHLPPGMGNVPFKKILEELEKAGRLDDVRKIVEAGGFVQHFQQSPLMYTLEGMGSPMHADGVGPYWNQAIGLYQGYFSGYGQMLPNTNYQTFGAGFSQLPAELGGQQGGGAGSRMSGRQME